MDKRDNLRDELEEVRAELTEMQETYKCGKNEQAAKKINKGKGVYRSPIPETPTIRKGEKTKGNKMEDDGRKPSYKKEENIFAEKATQANTEESRTVVGKVEKRKVTRLETLEKVFMIPERERRSSIRFNRRKGGRQGLSEGITIEMVRTKLYRTLEGLNFDAYCVRAGKKRLEDIQMCLAKKKIDRNHEGKESNDDEYG